MDELKILVGMIKELPGTALWIVGLYFFYKVVIVGSIYGTIRYGLDRLKDIIQVRNTAKVNSITESKKETIKDVIIDGLCISSDGTYEHIIESLKMVRGHVNTCEMTYLHKTDAKWLRLAIQERIEKDKTAAAEKQNAK